ncbi:nitrate- and nitrite sensing domain-containing protein [uncultured Streptomyces sp.]|uniref:sensor histidine kinase n=1 Tax=uncultured Streptomyces sp. TaxID=174707 RepID=UPI002639797E|nr:nitrate- and nitrite sensing domain-containing protein [uncultured Streptomyces sp.]
MRPPRPPQAPAAPHDRAIPAARGRRAHAGPPADERGEQDAAPTETGRRARGSLLRPRTVRAKVLSLLMVPVVSLLALWGLATVTTAQEVARLRQAERVEDTVRAPVQQAVAALQTERRAALVQLAAPDAEHAAALETAAGRTGEALDRLRMGEDHTVADTGSLPSRLAGRVSTLLDGTDRLTPLRAGMLDGPADGPETETAYLAYTEAIESAFRVSGALTGIQQAGTGSDARVLLELDRAGEMLSREDALLATGALTRTLDGTALRRFTGAVETRRLLMSSAGADLPGTERTAWTALTRSTAYRTVAAAEEAVLDAGSGRDAARAVAPGTWERAAAEVREELREAGTAAGRRVADRSDPLARGLLSPAGAAVAFGFLAVAAALVISVRIGRALVVELMSLRNSALVIARHELPRAMERLRAGEQLDVKAEAPPRRPSHDEIGQVGEALDIVHRAALGAAVERAELASGISGVFVNLARRSQVLVHRQLHLLDGMERRADDPEELADLFRLDHLTTRMRRHAESLIILSGAAPGRAWRMPVPLTNVVRAAVSEIEDYARVEVRQLADASVAGAAVADLTHLLAELVENAAQFSPPHTKVRISGEPVGNGYALEIEDRGLGMGKEILAQANRRIEQSEALDLFDSDRLGLFVVSRLSARHRVKVKLRTSPYGGTTAVVLLPTALLHTGAAETGQTSAGATPSDRPEPPAAARPGARVFPPPVAVPALEGVAAGPDGDRGRAARAAAARPVPALEQREHPAAGVPAGVAVRAEEPADDDLPRRVRQAHLVPQLRTVRPPDPAEDPGAAPLPAVGEGPLPQERTPEQVRDRMTAYRAGWARGGGPAPGRPRSVPAPGPTPEGERG